MTSDTTVVSVHYERKFSDGNYGSEGLSMTWTVTYDDSGSQLAADPNVVEARLKTIGGALRLAVLGELAQSQAKHVAWAANRELGTRAAINEQVDQDENIQPGDYHYYNPR